MQDVLNQIYSIDNIIVYIIIAIAILVILFLIILIFGKKDKKLEETKRLETLNNNLKEEPPFKDEQEPVKLETEAPINEKYPDILIPPVNNGVEPKEETEKTVTIPFETINERPILAKEEEKPLVFDNANISVQNEIPEPKQVEVTEFNETPSAPLFEQNVVEEQPKAPAFDIPVVNEPIFPKVEKEMELPKQQVTTEEKEMFRSQPQIFSSVYVNEHKPEPVQVSAVKEEVKEEPIKQTNDFDDLELPALKKIEDIPLEPNQFDIDAIAGETYDLK